jgi:hypothetical protein
LKLEIKITFFKLNTYEKELNVLYARLESMINVTTLLQFRIRVDKKHENIFISTKNDNIRKLKQLEGKYDNIDIKVGEKFIYNYTEVELPAGVKKLLSTGPKMCIPITKKEISIPNLIKDLEFNINICDTSNDNKTIIRNRAVNVVSNFYNNIERPDKNNVINKYYKETKQFLKENDNIYVLRSDKGNSTVVMYKNEYYDAMTRLLDDVNMYVKLSKDPTNIYQEKANKLIDKLTKKDLLKDEKYRFIKKKLNCVSPKLYGLRKTHKENLAMRPVVSCIGSPAYLLATYVHIILNPYVKSFKHNIKNSHEFVLQIKDVSLPPDYVLISLDVVSLFTNIPKDLVKNILKEKWNEIHKTKDKLDCETFLEIVDFLFDSSYFKFNNQFYQQLDGSAMGNPASPCLANLVMNYIVEEVKKKINFVLPFLKIYVDDSSLAVPKNKADYVLSVFNSCHEKIQFTIEMEENNRAPFLDVEIIRKDDGKLLTDWYHKPTASGRTLNYLSFSPSHYKKNIIINMLHKINTLSSAEFIPKNIKKMREILKQNNYPKFYINKIINEYYTKLNQNSNITNNINQNDNITNNPNQNDNANNISITDASNLTTETINQTTSKKFLKFAYIPAINKKIENIFREYDNTSKFVYYHDKKVSRLFSRIKDSEMKENQSYLIYKINCLGCEKSYVGQTRQYLKKRIYQHETDCKPSKENDDDKTALATHHFNGFPNHKFDFKNVKIIDKEKNGDKRNISEMVHIKLSNSCNFRTDTNKLSSHYMSLKEKYKKFYRN